MVLCGSMQGCRHLGFGQGLLEVQGGRLTMKNKLFYPSKRSLTFLFLPHDHFAQSKAQ